MNKFINYVKQGKGRGLRAMLIFSVLFSLFYWVGFYAVLSESFSGILVHPIFLTSLFAGIWIVYLMVVGVSALLYKLLRLKLEKGAVWRATSVSLIVILGTSLLMNLLAFLMALMGGNVFQLYPLVFILILSVSLATFFLSSVSEAKETKKKK